MEKGAQKEISGVLWIIAALIAFGDGSTVLGWAFAACGIFSMLASVFYDTQESNADKLREKIKAEKDGMGV